MKSAFCIILEELPGSWGNNSSVKDEIPAFAFVPVKVCSIYISVWRSIDT